MFNGAFVPTTNVVDPAVAARSRAGSFLTALPLKASEIHAPPTALTKAISEDEGDVPPPLSCPKNRKSWRWLSSFQRTLSYGTDHAESFSSSDDDAPPAAFVPPPEMSPADREAIDSLLSLERMTERGALMRESLSELAGCVVSIRDGGEGDGPKKPAVPGGAAGGVGVTDEDRMIHLLYVVRDVVHDRVDFGRAFVAVGGLEFLLGCAAQRSVLTRRVRAACLQMLAKLALGNVSVQLRLLDMGAVRTLSSLYFAEFPESTAADVKNREMEEEEEEKGAEIEVDTDGKIRAHIIQAMDAAVCDHVAAERKFCADRRGPKVVQWGLGLPHDPAVAPVPEEGDEEEDAAAVPPVSPPPPALRRRCLTFLRELLSSDNASADPKRADVFASAVRYAAKVMTIPDTEDDERCREAALSLVLKLLRNAKGGGRRLGGPPRPGNPAAAAVVSGMKYEILEIAERRVEEIRRMDAVEREVSGEIEMDLWSRITMELNKLP